MKDISKKSDAAPHDCTECGSPAYIPFSAPARCTGASVLLSGWVGACPRFDQQIYDEHVESCPDESVSVDMFVKQYRDFIDEKTDPQIVLPQPVWVQHVINMVGPENEKDLTP